MENNIEFKLETAQQRFSDNKFLLFFESLLREYRGVRKTFDMYMTYAKEKNLLTQDELDSWRYLHKTSHRKYRTRCLSFDQIFKQFDKRNVSL